MFKDGWKCGKGKNFIKEQGVFQEGIFKKDLLYMINKWYIYYYYYYYYFGYYY